MQVSYENDPQRGAGYGLLCCSGEDFSNKSGLRFALERASDHCFLSSNGEWNPQQAFLPVNEYKQTPTGIDLLLEPLFVNQLDVQERYKLRLKTDEGDLWQAQVKARQIIYSDAETLQQVPDSSAKIKEPAPTPEQKEENNDTQTSEPQNPPPPPAGKKHPFLIPLLSVLAGCLLLGGAIFFAYNKYADKSEHADQAPSEAKQGVVKTEAPQATPQGTEARVALFFKSQDRSPQEAAKLSRELAKNTPAEQDAVYRLYYFATENGESSVIMNYAACFDPAKPQWGTIKKDALLAWTIYAKAGAKQPEASQAQQELKTWLKNKADEGDAQATRWLRQLQ